MRISVGSWLVIDAVLDNAVAVAVQSDADDSFAAHAQRLRELGWAAAEAHPQRHLGPDDWPPRSAVFDIEASPADVSFMREHVDAAIEVTSSLLADDRLDGEARTEQERARSLAEQTRSELAAITGAP